MQREVLRAIIKGLISHLPFNTDIEENLSKIIRMKMQQMLPLLRKKGFDEDELLIQEELLKVASEEFQTILLEKIKPFILQSINSSIWESFKMTSMLKDSYIGYFEEYLKEHFKIERFRRIFYDIYELLKTDIIERYVRSLSRRKGFGYVYFFAKPVNSPKLLEEFLRLSILFYPTALEGIEYEGRTYFLDDYLKSSDNLRNFQSILKKYIVTHFDEIPDPIILTGLEASINKNQLMFDKGLNIRADLLRTLLILAKFKSKQSATNNKRAESPEKSLFSIFQKQNDFLGLEKNLLYEMELVARENKW